MAGLRDQGIVLQSLVASVCTAMAVQNLRGQPCPNRWDIDPQLFDFCSGAYVRPLCRRVRSLERAWNARRAKYLWTPTGRPGDRPLVHLVLQLPDETLMLVRWAWSQPADLPADRPAAAPRGGRVRHSVVVSPHATLFDDPCPPSPCRGIRRPGRSNSASPSSS